MEKTEYEKVKDRLLFETQMALGKTFPWIDERGKPECIHCGMTITYEALKSLRSHPDKLHRSTCVYLIALQSVGDYDNG